MRANPTIGEAILAAVGKQRLNDLDERMRLAAESAARSLVAEAERATRECE